MFRTGVRPALLTALFLLGVGWPTFLLSLPAQDVRPINNREYFPAVLDRLDHATQSIRLVMYLAQRYDQFPESPTNRLVEALTKARERGVDVEVILEKPGSKGERSDDLWQKNRQVEKILAQADVRVFEDSPGITTHAKVLVVDSRYTIIGSTNWTYAAIALNNETAVIIDSTEVAKEYMELFEKIKAQQ